VTAESGAVEYDANELDRLLKLHTAFHDLVESSGRRLVLEVWDFTDQRPIAWIEAHASDSLPKITFTDPRTRPGLPTQPTDAPDASEA